MPGNRSARTRWITVVGTVVTTAALLAGAHTAGAAPVPVTVSGPVETPEVECFDGPGGKPRHEVVPAEAPAEITRHRTSAAATPAAAVTPVQETGPVSGRLDLVIMGDGCTAAQQADSRTDAQAAIDSVFAIEPYADYRGLFDIWLVDTASAESGVPGAPTAGVVRDTAPSSYFFCEQTERLLCLDTSKVTAYANQAPASDIVFVVADSAKYGGAGHGFPTPPDGASYHGVATMSSDNPKSYLTGAHELGHSIGNLADEYPYAGYGAYPCPSSGSATVSVTPDLGTSKWYRWLGEQGPTGSVIGAYEGGDHYETGVYRPSSTSLMRTLSSTEFNHVGREAMIKGFCAYADGMTSTVPTGTPVRPGRKVGVRLAPVTGLSGLELAWHVDGKRVTWATGDPSVIPAELGATRGGVRPGPGPVALTCAAGRIAPGAVARGPFGAFASGVATPVRARVVD
ncbi:M64 family metallopeptidase [Streptomyces sp. NPDC004284]|uniref:M64 family metallopeptidase n=1 Tax=Streptomyces sp. NPDC004284 TaxID=3364695 RepID=UPI0036A2B24D